MREAYAEPHREVEVTAAFSMGLRRLFNGIRLALAIPEHRLGVPGVLRPPPAPRRLGCP
jgi:hypothetical protein